jgi:hypothetical protein
MPRLIYGLDRRADLRAARLFRSRLTESYYFSGNCKLEVESVLEEDDSRLDCRTDCCVERRAEPRAERRADLRGWSVVWLTTR